MNRSLIYQVMVSAPLLFSGDSAGIGPGPVFTGTGTDSDGSPISATVDFSHTGNVFQITLTNNNVSNSQATVLTNVGFNDVPSPALCRCQSAGSSAALTSGSFIVALGTPDAHTIGEEWAYLSGGAASSGFGVGTGDCRYAALQTAGPILKSAFGLVGTGTNLNQDGMTSRTYISSSVTIDITLSPTSTFVFPASRASISSTGTGSGEGTSPIQQEYWRLRLQSYQWRSPGDGAGASEPVAAGIGVGWPRRRASRYVSGGV